MADKICRTALEKFSQQHQPLLVSLESLGRHTVQMLHDVLDAFARMDLDEAVRIYREDKKVDQEYEGIVRQLMTYMMEDSRTIPSVLTALFCARSIERIGDRLPEHLRIYLLLRQRPGLPPRWRRRAG
ncbi:Phosphate transport system protein phoU [Raoultella terrigena]|uniref:Phosphate-specific transport system accessory protein PhoU n=1 Tax=Raoultella terrigena TaxID=577 RepID=A0A3P8KM76_RAOTE|nr:Phosphate transport system protein phoU [Raoultella terrigena]